MARIGIITCSNFIQEWSCVSSGCLEEIRERKGFFSTYPPNEKLDLVGIINCSGCPSINAPQKILRRVRPFVELQVDTIHLSTCMSAVCPFKQKYEQVIRKVYPEIKVVIGTHAGNQKLLQTSMHDFFYADLIGLFKEHLQNQNQKEGGPGSIGV